MLSFLPCLHTCQSVRLASCLFPGGVPGSTRPRYQGKRCGLGEPLEALVLTSPLKENPHSDSSEQMAALSSTVRDTSSLQTGCLACFAIFVPSKGQSSCRGRPGSWPYLGKRGTGSRHRATGLCYGQMTSFNPYSEVHGSDTDLRLMDVCLAGPLALQCSSALIRSPCYALSYYLSFLDKVADVRHFISLL